MAGSFVPSSAVSVDTLDWGGLGWVVNPTTAPGSDLTVLDVTIQPGQGHDFHRHPRQEEVIHVLSGAIEQWIEERHERLGPGDSVHVPTDTVHASFVADDADEPAHLLVVLTPSVTDVGYEAVDVADEAPWNDLRS
ncbi:cupin domain-containing protein [Salsipaludibacter albus]|uniref:cupin domain-containing protein n=1 Tax=Salsipaludibacter albus TaxID=2849650 RepID=UPI001EE400D0|nr:cupin domain-containing protein [Salsipaludibacter albus]MBY5164156.1 cupin domain-containing protein [Salsipaludibacter albus]